MLELIVEYGSVITKLAEALSGWVILIFVVCGLLFAIKWLNKRWEVEEKARSACEEDRFSQAVKLADLSGKMEVVHAKVEESNKERELSELRINNLILKSDQNFAEIHRGVLDAVSKGDK